MDSELELFSPNYLRATDYCDSEHPLVVRQARTLAAGRATDTARVIAAFEWVRDEIEYIMGVWNRRASAILFDRRGSCSTKTNLFVALCRAMGIPAGFHVMRVNGKAYYGKVIGKSLANLCSPVSIHVYAAVFLDGRWLKCDVSDDRKLCDSIGHLNPQTRLVEFDGTRDAMLHLLPEHIYSDSERLQDIDQMMSKPRRISDSLVNLLNSGITFCRHYGGSYGSLDDGFNDWFQLVQSAHGADLERCMAEFGQRTAAVAAR
jgi:hypothetical protein